MFHAQQFLSMAHQGGAQKGLKARATSLMELLTPSAGSSLSPDSETSPLCTLDQRVRKISQFSVHSDLSDTFEDGTDGNYNVERPPKILSKHYQVCWNRV